MCCNSSIDVQNHSMKATLSPSPARKTRTKTRKPKFLSLRQEFSPESSELVHHPSQMGRPQLTLFPLHPENLFEEKEMHVDPVDYFFDHDDLGGVTSLHGILGGGASSEESLCQSLAYAYRTPDSDGASSLAQAALRSRERDVSEEKWVVYSEVVEKKKKSQEEAAEEEETAKNMDLCYRTQGLSLKLDYEEILNAWSNKGPLYIDGESPQTVPDQAHDSTNVYIDVGGMGGNMKLWNVPDDGSSAIEDGGEGKMGQREARVMRYKEKRQSRLFSKRIRYEVRKINAEKRPRMKGRFVKRKSEA